jgi:hypothetical protein
VIGAAPNKKPPHSFLGEKLNQIEPQLQLGHTDRAHLVAIYAMEGYKVLNRIMRSEVDKFVVDVINADPAEPKKVLSKQLVMKAAAQFYAGITDRVNEEVTLYTSQPRPGDKPVDMTEGLLDLGALTEQLEEVPNLLGGE